MSDPGHEETDAILKDLEKRITKEYRRAEREIQAKLDDYLKRFETKDKIWQKWVEQGAKTEKQYQEWKIGQLAVGKQWSDQRQLIVRDLSQANKTARNIVSERMPTVYAVNHNYGTYEVEHGTGVDTYYALYDHDTVEGLFKERKIYHDPSEKVLSDIAKGKETRWNTKNVQSAMIQSILQGESMPKIATRIANTVGEQNRKAAIRNARTITTGVENRGRVDSYERARDKGINVRQQWLATLDGRTRHSHRVMDGEIVDPGEEFSNGCRFPGDPEGKPAEIYNCRCTLVAALKGFEHKATDLSTRNTNKLEGMTYEEWLKAKPKYQDILHQDMMEKRMKDLYIGDYKKLYNLDNTRKNGKISGAISGALNPNSKEADEHAERFYEEVRHRTTDYKKIAKNTRYSVKEIKEIKDYIFNEKHELDTGYERFAPDYEMSQSWQRLTEGKGIRKQDIIMLEHEKLERELVIDGMPQSEAHIVASKKYNYDKAVSEYNDRIKKNRNK